jgi:alpha-L-fucosidase
MDINKESIFDTRTWVVFGEGPSAANANPVNGPGFNDEKLKYSAADIRYNIKGKTLYATLLGIPDGNILMTALGTRKNGKAKIKKIGLLGGKEKIIWSQGDDHLSIKSPETIPNKIATVFKIELE